MSPLFPSVATEVQFWAVVVGGWIVFGAALARRERRYRSSIRKRIDPNIESQKLRALVVAFGLAMVAVAIGFGYARVAVLPAWLFYPGLVVYGLGFGLTFWAFSTLGKFYAGPIQVQDDHQVVDTGPYRLIRHPAYSGLIITALGIGLAVQSWAAILLLVAVFGVGFGARARTEERFLIAELGGDYQQYMTRTKRLIPYVL